LKHFASSAFWRAYHALPEDARARADKAYSLLTTEPRHPSLQLKRVGAYWSARIDHAHRALAAQADDGLVWFWIGRHDEYERLIKG
jgi:hypothetical protein